MSQMEESTEQQNYNRIAVKFAANLGEAKGAP